MNKKVDDALVNSVMKKLEKKKITVATASVLLGISEREIYKIKKKRKEPPKKIKNKPRKTPPNKTDKRIVKKVIKLYRTKYRNFPINTFMKNYWKSNILI